MIEHARNVASKASVLHARPWCGHRRAGLGETLHSCRLVQRGRGCFAARENRSKAIRQSTAANSARCLRKITIKVTETQATMIKAIAIGVALLDRGGPVLVRALVRSLGRVLGPVQQPGQRVGHAYRIAARTAAANASPRSPYPVNWSKDAPAGASRTVSPGFASLRAAPTAAVMTRIPKFSSDSFSPR